MTTLVVPKDRFSAIDFFIEKCDIAQTKGIKITNSEYDRMTKDPWLRKEAIAEGEKWIGEETTIDGRYYPPLSYILFKKDDGYIVTEIVYKGIKYNYSLKEYDVVIDY